MPRYYSNGTMRNDDKGPPNRDEFSYWFGPSVGSQMFDAPEDFNNPYYDTDEHAIIARREAYRRMGGKPANASAQQIAELKRESAQLVWFVANDPCAAFASTPPGERENHQAWAAFANWYWWLDPKYRWDLLRDILSGNCDRWMPVVLEMRKYAPAETMEDISYWPGDAALIRHVGDDPKVTSATPPPMAHPPQIGGSDANPCDNTWNTPAWCLAGDYKQPAWPVVGPDGLPLAIPGFPMPCSPFPGCLLDMLPAGVPTPCTPWPACAYDVAAAFAKATPGALVTRTSEGATYTPNEAPVEPEEPSKTSSYVLPVLLGVTAVATLAFAGVMSATANPTTNPAAKRITSGQLSMLGDVRSYGYVLGSRGSRGAPRLEGMGLITRSAPGMWRLTSRGEDVLAEFERTGRASVIWW
jgi:hypothetical protein